MTKPSVLLVALLPGHGGMHMPRRLARHGLRVDFIGSQSSLASRSSHVSTRMAWNWEGTSFSFDPFLAAVHRLKPARVIPLDELSAMRLEQVGRGEIEELSRPFPPPAVDLVRRSLGDPRGYGAGRARIACHQIAVHAGIAFPEQARVDGLQAVVAFGDRHGWPLVLKRELSMGGAGVFFADDPDHAAVVCSEHGMETGTWVVQRGLPGSLGMHAVLAQDGQVLAEVSALQLQRRSGRMTSPSSAVRLCRHAGMAEASARYAATAGLSGFHAWDFLLHGTSATMIEHNARPIAISTLGMLVGHDLCARLAGLLGGRPQPVPEGAPPEVDVALFPDEWLRDPLSPRLHTGYHDAPWDDGALLAAVASKRTRYR